MVISSWFKKFEKGQSLVEISLTLPLILIMIIGVVEIGQFLVTTNRIRTVANTSARFAANGGQNDGIPIVALNTVTQTLPFDTQYWDMWAIRGKVNEEGTGLETWEFTHVYGDQMTQDFDAVEESVIQIEVLNNLKNQVGGSADDGVQAAKEVEFAGTLVLYDAQSILGLEYFLGDLFTVQALNVMRTYPVNPTTNGCTAFPIAIEEGIRHITWANEDEPDSPYPAVDSFDYPDPGPNPSTFNLPTNSDEAESPRSILNAQPGDLFLVFNGSGSGSFGWLAWNSYATANANTVGNALAWPGNSDDYTTVVGGQTPPGFDHPVLGFIDPTDPTDVDMHIHDWVVLKTGVNNSNGIRDTLDEHIDLNRSLRLVVWRYPTQGSGSNQIAEISHFAVMRLIGYSLPANGGWVLAEFISHDTSCGQVSQ